MPPPAPIRLSLRFTGRVQGVGFRATTRHTARGFPVTGWVRNEPDGSVACEVQGLPQDIEAFLTELRVRLSPFIATESRSSLSPASNEATFEILR